MSVDVAGQHQGTPHPGPAPVSKAPAESPFHVETETYTAKQLGIVRKARMLFWMVLGTGLLIRHGLTARRVLELAGLPERP